jgi:hypothetical protein
VAGGINVGLNFWVIPTFGMFGAACTTLLCYSLLAFQVYFISHHYYPVRYEWVRLIKAVAATAVALLAALGVNLLVGGGAQQPFTDVLWKQAVVAPTLLLFPLVLWLTRFFTPREKARLAARLPLVGRRRRSMPAAPAAAAAGAASGAGSIVGAGEGVSSADKEEAEEREQEEWEEERDAEMPSAGGGIV